TNGAVAPTVASSTMPDCSLALSRVTAWRRARSTNSERVRVSPRPPASERWWWAAAWAASRAIFENGSLRGCSSITRMASWAFGASQKALTTRSAADFRRMFLMALKMVQYQDAADIRTRVMSTIQETANSPGLVV